MGNRHGRLTFSTLGEVTSGVLSFGLEVESSAAANTVALNATAHRGVSLLQLSLKEDQQVLDRDPVLRTGVALSHRDGVLQFIAFLA